MEKNTPLHLLFSIFAKDSKTAAEIAHLLIEHGANPNLQNTDGWCPLHLAVRRGQADCVKWVTKHNLLMKAEAKYDKIFDVNESGGSDKWTPLHLASSLGHYEILHLLLESDTDLMNRTRTGKSVRDVAANNLIVTKILRRAENEWMNKNLFRTDDLEHKLREVTQSGNVQQMKSMIQNNTAKVLNPIHQNKDKKTRDILYVTNGSARTKPRTSITKDKKDMNEDSLLINDVDETIETKETTRTIPRSPNNIQKIQIAQNYRNHIMSNNVFGGEHANYPTLLKDHKKERGHSSGASTTTGTKLANIKFMFPSDFRTYIKNFDNYEDEIKKFQDNVASLSEEMAFSEKLKYLFYLKVIHYKINHGLKRIHSELLPMELFIICEFIDDELKRTRYQYKRNQLSTLQNNDIIPRTFLFLFESLDNNTSEGMLIKGKISEFFSDIKYVSAKHFLQQFLDSNPNNKYLRREIKMALKEISEISLKKSFEMSSASGSFVGSYSNTMNYSSAVKEKSSGQYSTAGYQSVNVNKISKGSFLDKCENIDDEEEGVENLSGINATKKYKQIPKFDISEERVEDSKDSASSRFKGFSLLNTEIAESKKELNIRDSPTKLRVGDYFSNV